MANDLKNFLDGEKKECENYFYTLRYDSTEADVLKWLNNHDTRLINFVLDLVKSDVEKNARELKHCVRGSDYCCVSCDGGLSSCEYVEQDMNYNQALTDISTIINNLKI